MTAAPHILKALFDIDAALARAGVPTMSDYWRHESTRFYEHPTATVLVEEVGRGGGKNLHSLKMGIAETLAGEFNIPAAERHWFVHVAENLSEAGKDRRQTEQYLAILNVEFDSAGDAIELRHMPRGFRILAARIGAVSGWRTFGWTLNEAAKLNTDGVNPSSELAASMRAMTITHGRKARGRIVSSPMGRAGFFYAQCERGNTDDQVYGNAPSWIANPTISEEQTHALESDLRVWSREYLAVPQAGILAAFDARQIDYATRVTIPADWSASERIILIDPSAGGSDSWAWCVVGWRRSAAGQTLLEVTDVDGISDAAGKGLTLDDVLRKIKALGRRVGTTEIRGDQYERFALTSAFARAGFSYFAHNWSQQTKERAVEHVRGWLRDGMLCLPKHDKLRAELCAFEERVSASGALTFRGRGATHDDHAMLILLAALVDIEVGLSGSPSGHRVSGQGMIEFYEIQAARLEGGPSPLIVAAAPEEDVELVAPPKFAGCSTVTALSGASYSMQPGGRIFAKPSDVESLKRSLGFTHAE